MRSLLTAVAVVVVGCTLGCDTSPSPAMGEYVEVKGTVTAADGKPVKVATIFFEPDGPGGRDQFVDVKDGAFDLKLFAAKYKVALDVDAKRSAVPAKYTKFASSGLKAEVTAGMSPLGYTLK